jgi:GTPase SAR1 family protein
LVGNKIDLEKEREVGYEEGMNLANQLGIDFIEVSVKERMNINNIFNILTKKYFEYENFKIENSEKIEIKIEKKKKGFFSSLSNDEIEIKFSKN